MALTNAGFGIQFVPAPKTATSTPSVNAEVVSHAAQVESVADTAPEMMAAPVADNMTAQDVIQPVAAQQPEPEVVLHE